MSYEECPDCGEYVCTHMETRLVAAEARCHDLERQRTEYDCRFVGRYAEMSGSHCPPGEPCQRCELEAAEARCAELEDALSLICDTSERVADVAICEMKGIARRALAGGGK